VIPIRDDIPTVRTPIVTIALLVVLALVWIFVQGAGLDERVLAQSICGLGLVPGELTGRAPPGTEVPIAPGLACVVEGHASDWYTLVTSMFLHGGWWHLVGNGLFLWVFGNNVEDRMGRARFLVFYLVCGLAAAALQIAVRPDSPVPMVGASGAIAGVLGAYLVLFPRARVQVLVPLFIVWPILTLPAWAMLLWWIGFQILAALPELATVAPRVSSGVAVFAHVGGFFCGALLVKLFARRSPQVGLPRRWISY
jgi:membrane associated rhomboid family serine protease